MITRRDFLKVGGIALAGGLAASRPVAAEANPVEAASTLYQGVNLKGWKVALGDALYAAPGEPPVDLTDIKTVHRTGYSELQANVKRRVIKAHNITYKPITTPAALNTIHTCSVSFRLPYLPKPDPTEPFNGQTAECGIFVWDDPDTRLDYGMAFQWLLNPWDIGSKSPGTIRIWNGKDWARIGKIPLDTDWHTAKLVVDIKRRNTLLLLDNKIQLSRFSITTKPASWGNTVDARFQVEAVSADPRPNNTLTAMHKVQFKNWKWLWEPAVC